MIISHDTSTVCIGKKCDDTIHLIPAQFENSRTFMVKDFFNFPKIVARIFYPSGMSNKLISLVVPKVSKNVLFSSF